MIQRIIANCCEIIVQVGDNGSVKCREGEQEDKQGRQEKEGEEKENKTRGRKCTSKGRGHPDLCYNVLWLTHKVLCERRSSGCCAGHSAALLSALWPRKD